MKTITLSLVVLLVGCATSKPPAPPPPTGEFCEAAEKNQAKLQCPNGRGGLHGGPNQSGETWGQVCSRVEREGKVSMRAECLAKAASCAEVESCQRQ